jgi:hypothetical protein
MSLKTRSTFVLVEPSEILEALVGLKDVRVLRYERNGADVELMIEQVLDEVRCPSCARVAEVKERPVVRYVDLPVYGVPMHLAWKKHRMRCRDERCPTKSWTVGDHRIAAKNCLLTTRAAKWATVQVGTGRTVKEVAGELDCDWHTVNDAVTTYGQALLEADRKRLNQTSAIGLDETSFVRLGPYKHTSFATTVADVENHQIIDILPSRDYREVAGWIDAQPPAWKERIRYGALDMSVPSMPRCTRWSCPKQPRWSIPSTSSPSPIAASMTCGAGSRPNRPGTGVEKTIRSTGPAGSCSWARRNSTTRPRPDWPPCSSWATPTPKWPSPIGSKSACVTSMAPMTPTTPASSKSLPAIA